MGERIQEKNKSKKKRSKLKSRDAEETPLVKRIMISDDQIEMSNAEVLTKPLVDTVKLFAHSETLVVSQLGSGISRGSMNYGRLHQGKYIPPERTDGLLSQCEDKESVKEEICLEYFTKSATDIDLD